MLKECRDSREQVTVESLQKLDGTYYYSYPWHEKSKCHPNNIKAEVAKRGVEEAEHNNDLIIKNLMNGALSAQDLAGALDLKASDVLLYLAYAGCEWDYDLQLWRLPKADKEVDSDRKFAKLKEEVKTFKIKYVAAQTRIENLEKQLETIDSFPHELSRNPIDIVENEDKTQEATALFLLSDVHPGKHVILSHTHGLNEFNPEIAEYRIKKYFTNVQKLLDSMRRNVTIDNTVLWLGGDMIENYLREENLLTNTMSPTEEIIFMQALLSSGIEHLLNDPKTKSLKVICSEGNHDRQPQQRKTPVGGRQETSLGTLLYKSLAREFKNTDKVDFQIADSYLSFLNVYNKKICFHHGDQISYGGGVGGIAVPLMGWLRKSNQALRRDLDVIGHFHQRVTFPGCLVNGSVCGYDDYAISKGFGFELPQQTFQLIDNKYGFTVNAPIVLS